MLLIALDVGERRIGVAGNDALGITVQPITTIQRTHIQEDIGKILNIVNERGAQAIVAGLPYNMDGTLGFQAQRVEKFCQTLKEASDLPIYFFDERLTSAQSEKELIQLGMRRDKRKQVIDRLAAVHILEGYLQRQRAQTAREGKKMSEFDESSAIVELIDEDGNEVTFEHVLTLAHNGDSYAFLIPLEGLEEEEEDEGMVVLKIVPGEEGEDSDSYEGVEDELLLEELYSLYLQEVEELDD